MFSTIRRLLKRKRKRNKPIDHPSYFVSEIELQFIEVNEAFIQVLKLQPTAAEVAETLFRIFASFPSAEELFGDTWANSQ